jgi:hypothetical protein
MRSRVLAIHAGVQGWSAVCTAASASHLLELYLRRLHCPNSFAKISAMVGSAKHHRIMSRPFISDSHLSLYFVRVGRPRHETRPTSDHHGYAQLAVQHPVARTIRAFHRHVENALRPIDGLINKETTTESFTSVESEDLNRAGAQYEMHRKEQPWA